MCYEWTCTDLAITITPTYKIKFLPVNAKLALPTLGEQTHSWTVLTCKSNHLEFYDVYSLEKQVMSHEVFVFSTDHKFISKSAA